MIGHHAFRGMQALALTLALPLAAESVNPPTKPQTAPMTAQEKKNLEMVMNWWREVLHAGHFELAPKYQAETYIQHNPNVNTGRAGFIEFFTKLGIKPQSMAASARLFLGAQEDNARLSQNRAAAGRAKAGH